MNVKNIFSKQNAMPVLVLGVICLVVAALLGVVNMITDPIITKAEEQKVYDSLREVLDGDFKPVELPEDAPSSVTGLFKVTEEGELVGHVVTVEKQGYASKLSLTVGIDKDGKSTGVIITAQQETHGKDISPVVNGLSAGITADKVGDVDHVSNATVTSKTIKSAVADAFAVVGFGDGAEDADDTDGEEEVLPRTDDEILSLATELVGVNAKFTEVTPDETNFVKRVYKENGGEGYVAYVVVISQSYGTVESEALIHIGNNGKIKNINKLTWKTSDAIYGYVPPSEDAVNEFYAKLKDKNLENIGDVELVTNATNTSTNVVVSFTEALTVVDSLRKKDMPRDEEELLSLAQSLVGEGAEFVDATPEQTSFVKKIYRASGGKGYVAYVVVISQSYGTVESEALIHIGNNGKIKNINKLTWKTSDAIYGYVPPSEEAVDAFYERLVGVDSEALSEVELVTNATNTSTNVVASFAEALNAVTDMLKADMPRDEAEVVAYAKDLIGSTELVDVTPASVGDVKRLYRDNNGNGYVAYTVIISQYGTVETETLIHIDNAGTVKEVRKLIWKTSDAIYGYVPPSEEAVDAFYERLAGVNSETLSDVELVANATNTSTNLVAAVSEALDKVASLTEADDTEPMVDNTPRIVGIVILALAFVGVTAFVVYKKVIVRRKNG